VERLFQILFPRESICTEKALYYRMPETDSSNIEQKGFSFVIQKGACVSFDTYFNAFPFCSFREYTCMDSVCIILQAEGTFAFRLFSLHLKNETETQRNLLQEKEIACTKNDEVCLRQNFSALPKEGILYLEIEALSDCVEFYGGYFAADDSVRQNRVKIASVVCTYKREAFVYRNMENVTQAVYGNPESPIRDNIDFFVVDNGHTVDRSLVKNEHISVFTNKNWGGTGGFTRGILEACREPGKYTHVLLMDDDILFETDVLNRTVGFLKVLKPEYEQYCLAAGMLVKDQPFLQYAAGGVWKGRCGKLLNSGLDLRNRRSILLNNRNERADYSSWWYTCLPIAAVWDYGLPFPLFIKADDEEYGIRTGGNVLFLSGIDVWHDSFDAKYNARLEYYIKRNELILNALHFPRYGLWHNLLKLFLSLGKQALFYHFAGVDYLFAAYRDFLEGPDFFLRTDAEELNRQLSEMPKNTRIRSFLPMFAEFFRMAAKMFAGYGAASESYRNRLKELTSFGFWCSRLGVEPVSAQLSDKTTQSGSVQSR
jgi:galactofuranosylgalactofuranosylrhamnosyl-N-acetylglucosaminyl-diphospho-decaprenol beta-1,5/1,6-galactofuranosyltransferase